MLNHHLQHFDQEDADALDTPEMMMTQIGMDDDEEAVYNCPRAWLQRLNALTIDINTEHNDPVLQRTNLLTIAL